MMSVKKDGMELIIRKGEYIMPRAAKPTITGRPKPAPKPLVGIAPPRSTR
jgi:hypothetical protein